MTYFHWMFYNVQLLNVTNSNYNYFKQKKIVAVNYDQQHFPIKQLPQFTIISRIIGIIRMMI